ncbi:MAG: hypothetical protein LIO91_00590 [Bacteroidales bacterium]|nr:hypothetical protein [Bacteroidales bacterium]
MTDESLAAIRAIIDRNCLWLELLPDFGEEIWREAQGIELVPLTVPTLQLKVKRTHSPYRKNRVIQVSFYDLDVAARKASMNQ